MPRSYRYHRVRIGPALAVIVCMLAGNAAAQSQEVQRGPAGVAQVPVADAEQRTIWLMHQWARDRLKVVYSIGGAYQPEAMAQINRFLRDRRCNKSIDIDPKLIDLIYDLNQEFGGTQPVHVVSAYRSEGYNASLLRAGRTVDPHSQHTLGHAMDVFFPGVPVERLREAAIKHAAGGVGHYPLSWPHFVHLDTGPVRQWVEAGPFDRPRRHRLRVDCSLTMADVYAKIPEEQAIAALPAGAVVKTTTDHGDGIPSCSAIEPLTPLQTIRTPARKS